MVRLTDRPTMTIAVDFGRKATKQTNDPSLSLAERADFCLALSQMLCSVTHLISDVVWL